MIQFFHSRGQKSIGNCLSIDQLLALYCSRSDSFNDIPLSAKEQKDQWQRSGYGCRHSQGIDTSRLRRKLFHSQLNGK